ncbi:MAG: hypothetical protein GX862_04770, partial [Leucobacter sp.]|nr:hypothetical protein [Leucobacter sp.]
LIAEIQACSVQWVGDTCGGTQSGVLWQGPLDVGGEAQALLSMPDDESRWVLVSATLPTAATGLVSVVLQASGASETVVIDPATVGSLSATGSGGSFALWLGGAAVLAGLVVAGTAAVVRRRRGGGE